MCVCVCVCVWGGGGGGGGHELSNLRSLKDALLKFGNKKGKAEFSSYLKITEYNIYKPLPYQVIKWSLFLKICT